MIDVGASRMNVYLNKKQYCVVRGGDLKLW